MAIFPKVQSPCPFVDRLSTMMAGDVCRACKRQVFDLSAMSDGERVAFMKGRSSRVGVSYKMRATPAVRAAMIPAGLAAPAAACPDETSVVVVVTGGGITDPAN